MTAKPIVIDDFIDLRKQSLNPLLGSYSETGPSFPSCVCKLTEHIWWALNFTNVSG